jgi:hypothetical protein
MGRHRNRHARDGKTARFAIQSSYDPYSSDAMNLAHKITDVANAARPNTSLAGATVSIAGFPAVNSDIQRLLSADFHQLAIPTLVIVGIILILLVRALVAPLYLLGTVVLNYAAALGIGTLVFQYGFGMEIAWPVTLLAFIILVAVGADYNMLLISPTTRRIRPQHPRRRPANGRKHRLRHHISRTDLRRQHVRTHRRLNRNHDPSRIHHRLRTTTRHLRRTHGHGSRYRHTAPRSQLVAPTEIP